MPHTAKTHEECLELVCAVCTNLRGNKASRPVKKSEVILIKKHVYEDYQKESIWCPRGICTQCATALNSLEKQEKIEENKRKKISLTLAEDYLCEIPIQTRKRASSICDCRWCKLARMNGLEFRKWQQGIKKSTPQLITYICCGCGKGVPATVKSHTCNVSDKERVKSFLESIPENIKGKLTVALLRDQQQLGEPSGSSITLPQPQGGKPVEVTIGHHSDPPTVEQMSAKEAQVMAAKAHLTGEQQESILADLRSKFGREILEPGIQKVIPVENRKYAHLFISEEKTFFDTQDIPVKKQLYYCHSPLEFVAAVDKERGLEGVEQVTLIQGDTGQGFLKLSMSRIRADELNPGENKGDDSKTKKKRRTREEGVLGGREFNDWGVRKLLILAIVRKVPESACNLQIIFDAIKLNKLQFKLTGDFSFFMPCIGLLKAGPNICP